MPQGLPMPGELHHWREALDLICIPRSVPTAEVPCYGPSQIQNAYRFTPPYKAGITGRGRTIAIVDAFQSPTIREDLALFDQTFGLPDPRFTIVAPDGLTPFDENDPNQVGWAVEISLDVQWAHAIAPDAAITLVLAKSNEDADILSATRYVVDHGSPTSSRRASARPRSAWTRRSCALSTSCSSGPPPSGSPWWRPRATTAPPSRAATAPT